MQNLTYSFPAQAAVARAAHVGVVASGDLEILVQPPDAGHPALGRALHLGYFLGYANWNYFTTPFLFSYPGLVANEIEPWHEAGQTWRRLQVRFPSSIATHNPEQVFYFDSTGLQRRMDYVTEVLGSTLVGHYSSQYRSFDGLSVATRRRIFRRNPDNTVNLNQPSITLDSRNVEQCYANEQALP